MAARGKSREARSTRRCRPWLPASTMSPGRWRSAGEPGKVAGMKTMRRTTRSLIGLVGEHSRMRSGVGSRPATTWRRPQRPDGRSRPSTPPPWTLLPSSRACGAGSPMVRSDIVRRPRRRPPPLPPPPPVLRCRWRPLRDRASEPGEHLEAALRPTARPLRRRWPARGSDARQRTRTPTVPAPAQAPAQAPAPAAGELGSRPPSRRTCCSSSGAGFGRRSRRRERLRGWRTTW
mmetsp:Transcript_87247/g.281863  ORF Transcript_87247/g.281863 Transcript_87247/m.281863 type:complete len:233 (-) Transcript_87247:172-870(-)